MLQLVRQEEHVEELLLGLLADEGPSCRCESGAGLAPAAVRLRLGLGQKEASADPLLPQLQGLPAHGILHLRRSFR